MDTAAATLSSVMVGLGPPAQADIRRRAIHEFRWA
jgi:hypothetical protein